MRFHIDQPCGESWEDMTPRPGGRHCARCDHTVIDLTKLTRRHATERVRQAASDGYVCVQLAVDPNGTAQFRPEATRLVTWAAGLGLAAALASGCERTNGAESGRELVEESASPEPCAIPVTHTPEPPRTGQVEVSVVDAATEPTAEQRALTARKNEPPIVHHVRGRMPIRSF